MWPKSASRPTAITIGVVVLVAIGVTLGAAARLSEPAAPSPTQVRAALAASVRFSPARSATSVAPNQPIVVQGGSGRLVAVRAASETGGIVAGELLASANEWRSRGPLDVGARYRVTATVVGGSGVRADAMTTFRTLAPAARVGTVVFPWQGLEVGVGEPIVFTLSRSVPTDAARQSLLSHVWVTESQPVAGGWHWFSDRELHFRPRTFWPAGERVAVRWDLRGWNAGGGAWGTAEGSSTFTVGDAHVSIANLATDQMTVSSNGKTIATYPISGGKVTDPTMGGVHIVLDRATVVRMVSSTNGIPVNSADGYDELVYDDVHISDSGEYVHAAPWSVTSQGRTNVSHGCINLSPDDAAAFYAFSGFGDVVLVVGSPRPPVTGDHGVMDWTTNWAAFTSPR
ncbi:MAG TPA: Ig-like domain-containing protein [Acidimicrobiia bacterium]|jgi:lipoprotein-anchoring transpeptidase ErfK/SrfK|nr:Ig-like domain-containing protein [Acidimicrobiia bacterium]